MRQIITFFIMCLVAFTASAQNVADILVSYDYTYPNLRTGEVDGKSQYILLANGNSSKFYSPKTQYIDSLNATPQGKTALAEMTHAAVASGDFDKIPSRDGSFYVTKSSGLLRTYDSAGAAKYVVEESVPGINWEICDSIKVILGYECTKAVAEFHGRRWTAWFTPEVPLQTGPWKLLGLPGLILEADADGQYSFVVTGLQQTKQQIASVPSAESYEKTSRKNYLKTKRSFIDNPLGAVDAQFGDSGTTSVTDENGNPIDVNARLFVTREVVDFLETDY